MSLFFFQVGHGDYSGFSDNDLDVVDRNAAWAELTKVCGDLIGDVARDLKQNAEWQINLLDQSKKPVFRIRLVAETLD
jgi:hypothetical protein